MEQKRVIFSLGDKCYLRPPIEEDAELLFRGINEPVSRAAFELRYPRTLEEEKDWIKGNDYDIRLSICNLEDQFVGIIELHHIDNISGTGETSTLILEEYRQKGYGTDAKFQLLKHAFCTMNMHLVKSEVFAFNEASMASLKKCGYDHMAEIPESVFFDGKRWSTHIFTIKKEAFQKTYKNYRDSILS